MTEVLNPVDIESAIRDVSNRIAGSVKVCSERYAAFLTADRAYDKAVALASLSHEGAAWRAKYEAELATEAARKARDDADVAYRYADRLARALESELRAWQSVGASVRAMYSVAGSHS